MTVQQIIAKYQGVTELPGNSGFKQNWFQKLISKAGWYFGAPWCAFAVEVFVTEMYGAENAKKISGSALKTYLNLDKYKSTQPKPGGLVVWRMYKNGKPTRAGHIGMVTAKWKYTFNSLEGNTSNKFTREGEGVFLKSHDISWKKPTDMLKSKYTGLVLLGFIDPPVEGTVW